MWRQVARCALVPRVALVNPARSLSHHGHHETLPNIVGGPGKYELTQEQSDHFYPRIGNRDIVGSGINNRPNYADLFNFPYPAVRWGENTADVMRLRDKERGDWKKLSVDEAKQLYRASFRQTFAEFNAPTGEWKFIIAFTLGAMSLSLWIWWSIKKFCHPQLPHTFSDEYRYQMLKKYIDMDVAPVRGLTSQWDYERMKWKWEKD